MRLSFLSPAALAVLICAGCGTDNSSQPEAGSQQGSTAELGEPTAELGAPAAGGPESPAAAEPADGGGDSHTGQHSLEDLLVVRDWNGVEALIAEHRGKVVVVDLWSTYCEPCLREFPNLVALQKKYPDDVVCIAVNTNYTGLGDEMPESFREDVLEFMRTQDARFPNVISSVPDEALYEMLGIASVPVVYVYDRDGERRQQFDNEQASKPEDEFTYQKDVVPLVEELIGEEN